MFHGVLFVERGGLAAYSATDNQLGRQAARAKALGLAIPKSVLVRADRLFP